MKIAGVTEAIEDEVNNIAFLDPFREIDLIESDMSFEKYHQCLSEVHDYSGCFLKKNYLEQAGGTFRSEGQYFHFHARQR